MNERIKELAEQAGFFVLSDDKIYIPTISEEITDCQIKFAELIVEECAELVETQHTWITSVAASALIRKHFGVE